MICLQQNDPPVTQTTNNTEARFMISPNWKSSLTSTAIRTPAVQGQTVDHVFSLDNAAAAELWGDEV